LVNKFFLLRGVILYKAYFYLLLLKISRKVMDILPNTSVRPCQTHNKIIRFRWSHKRARIVCWQFNLESYCRTVTDYDQVKVSAESLICREYQACFCWCWQLIAMTDIKEMTPEFQKLNKTDNCIVIYLKNDARIAVTSQVWHSSSQVWHYLSHHRYDIPRHRCDIVVTWQVWHCCWQLWYCCHLTQVGTVPHNLTELVKAASYYWSLENHTKKLIRT